MTSQQVNLPKNCCTCGNIFMTSPNASRVSTNPHPTKLSAFSRNICLVNNAPDRLDASLSRKQHSNRAWRNVPMTADFALRPVEPNLDCNTANLGHLTDSLISVGEISSSGCMMRIKSSPSSFGTPQWDRSVTGRQVGSVAYFPDRLERCIISPG